MATLEFGEDHYVKGLDPVADAFDSTVYSDVVRLSNFHSVAFVIYKGVGATGTSTITVEACDDVVPTNTSAIPFYVQKYTGSDDVPGDVTAVAAAGFATTAGSSQIYVIRADAAHAGALGYGFVRLKAVEVVNSPVLGGILIILEDARNKDRIPATAIA